MRRAFITLTVAALFLLHGFASAEDLVFSRFESYLESLRTQTGIPGLAAAVVGKSDVLWEGASGMQDVDRSLPMRLDTPVHIDGLTEAFSATLVLRCVEEGRLSLDERIGDFSAEAADPDLTVRQVLTYVSGPAANPVYAYRPDRLQPLTEAVRRCTDHSFRETLANLFDWLAMVDAVPGPDVLTLVPPPAPPAESVLASDLARYAQTLARLSLPYAVSATKRPTVSQYSATTLTPTSGVIATVRDLEQFDIALQNGTLLQSDTLAAAWRAPVAVTNGTTNSVINSTLTSAVTSPKLPPHGMGWFVQTYKGEPVVWQFGASDNGSSSMMVLLPARSLTLILVANSTGLVKSFDLPNGDISASPFGQLFLQMFVR
ncbi:MAG: beta-lactamase family protein [Acidobacteriaceae bacterium]|jgi:CubicO group peptidase (beta-lactamase class C family)|nr:beta-lactamase family protein [Acidobacteriaceae bacterium]